MIAISACLLGINCRYDGGNSLKKTLLESSEEYLPICPEGLGGLPTPRNPAEIEGGDGTDVLKGSAKVIDIKGNDVTIHFIMGAGETLRLIKDANIKRVIMKEGSPSCGVKRIHKNGKSIKGMGVTTARLLMEGLEVIGMD